MLGPSGQCLSWGATPREKGETSLDLPYLPHQYHWEAGMENTEEGPNRKTVACL